MSSPSRQPGRLYVEGTDDQYVVIHLMKRLRPAWSKEPKKWGGGFEIENSKNDGNAVEDFGVAIKEAAPARIGLLLDADDQDGCRLADRWAAVCAAAEPHLAEAPPPEPPTTGYLATTALGLRLGAWIMPDNARMGALEAFLEPFVPACDPCWSFAEQAVKRAEQLGAPLREHHRGKARLHTWLAWRREAGRPYGRAIQCGDLDPTIDPTALAFADWFERLFVEP